MKKVLTLAALLAAASVSFGQGYLNFQNTSTTRISTNGTAVALAGGPVGNWYYALLWAPAAQNTVDATLAGWTFALNGTNTTSTGRMNGNSLGGGGNAAINALDSTSTADLVVVGWSANLGTDWNVVFAGRPNQLQPNTGGIT